MRPGRRSVFSASLLALALVAGGCASPPPTVVERGAMSPPPPEPATELSESLRPPPEETLRQEMSRWEALDREWQARQRAGARSAAPGTPAEEPLAPPTQMTLAPSASGAAGIPATEAGAATQPACPLGLVAHAPPETIERGLGTAGRPAGGGDHGDWREYGLPDGSRVSVGYYGGRALAFSVQLSPVRGTPDPERCVYAAFGVSTGALTRTGSSRDTQTWSGLLGDLPLRYLRAVKQGDRYSLAQAALDFPGSNSGPASIGAPVTGPAPLAPPTGTSGFAGATGATAAQCQGVTKEGRRCRRTTTNPSGLCYQHGG